MPLSNQPHWPWQAAVGVLLAAAVFAAASAPLQMTGTPPTPVRWFAIAATALVPGVLIGWAFADAPLQSLGAGGWIHSLAMLAIALTSPVAGAAMLMRKIPAPSFSEVLGHPKDRPPTRAGLALGIAWVVLCVIATEVALGLAFDPRYRDFPFAPLGAAATPFLVLAFLGAPARRRELAEIVIASVLAASTLYIAWNEGLANWQSLGLCVVFAAIVMALLRPRAGPSSE